MRFLAVKEFSRSVNTLQSYSKKMAHGVQSLLTMSAVIQSQLVVLLDSKSAMARPTQYDTAAC